MEYTINFFHNLDDILKGTHLRLVFVAIIGFAIFMKGIRHVINDFPVLVSYYKRAKREGYTDFQFFINNAHNIGMDLARKPRHQKPQLQAQWRKEIDDITARL